jgi:hypothetical protein
LAAKVGESASKVVFEKTFSDGSILRVTNGLIWALVLVYGIDKAIEILKEIGSSYADSTAANVLTPWINFFK